MQIAAASWQVGNLSSERNGVLLAGPIEEVHMCLKVWASMHQGTLIFTMLTEDLMKTRFQELIQ